MHPLFTKESRDIPAVPWNRYPRPQMVRKDWLCLNGVWDLQIGGRPSVPVRVPFCPESLLSRVETPPRIGETLSYRRTFTLPEGWNGKKILLHCGAVSRYARVLLNGRELGTHENSYLPFTVDVSPALTEGENLLEIIAVNDLSHKYPWGKQSENRGGMWYTPVSGIWQTVWLEPVPEEHIQSLSIAATASQVSIRVHGIQDGVVLFSGKSYPLKDGSVIIRVPDPVLWSPECPHLYPFTVVCGSDTVTSYFALRTLTTELRGGIPRLCLNGKPFFFHGLLDQGYWSDGLYTPASPECYEKDILTMKSLGFNTLRKHIKIEPEQFYYDCDRLGMIVFQDMVNCGDYSFFHDTILPTIHFLSRDDTGLHPDPDTRLHFLKAMDETVSLLGNHPCICLWTIFNEGWGQFCADDAYNRLKELDPTRFIDSTSGWFHQKKSDVDSLHIYFAKLRLGRQDLPQLLSEFGGYSFKLFTHSANLKKTYGYRKFENREQYVEALKSLYWEQVLPLVKDGLCGAIYTQVSDVEDETNGLFTFDRRVLKVGPEDLKGIADALQDAICGIFRSRS